MLGSSAVGYAANMKTDCGSASDEDDMGRIGILHKCRVEGVGVVRASGEYRLVAIRPITAVERLFAIEGELANRPSRYSVQIGVNLHIDLGSGHSAEEILDRYFWRFMNHSCDPNALIRGREVIAWRDIEPWEAVTFNYNTTEWDMAEPFTCRCGSPDCLGTIRGFKHLTPTQRKRLGVVAPHLGHHLLGEPPVTGMTVLAAELSGV